MEAKVEVAVPLEELTGLPLNAKASIGVTTKDDEVPELPDRLLPLGEEVPPADREINLDTILSAMGLKPDRADIAIDIKSLLTTPKPVVGEPVVRMSRPNYRPKTKVVKGP